MCLLCLQLDSYFPRQYVAQTALEQHDKVSAGKYTVGLGQSALAFVTDREDINSICLSAVSQFMEKNGIPYSAIGRLEVATETIQDHSKSVRLLSVVSSSVPFRDSFSASSLAWLPLQVGEDGADAAVQGERQHGRGGHRHVQRVLRRHGCAVQLAGVGGV